MTGNPIHRMQLASLRDRGVEGEAWILEKYITDPAISVHKLVKLLDVSTNAFYVWLKEDPERWVRWQEAKKIRAELLAEETTEISDNVKEDPDHIAKAHLKIKTRQWLAKVLDPDTFGEKRETVVQIGELHLTAVKEINAADTTRRLAAAREKEEEEAVEADFEVMPSPADQDQDPDPDDIESML